jgi:hypothetical protein
VSKEKAIYITTFGWKIPLAVCMHAAFCIEFVFLQVIVWFHFAGSHRQPVRSLAVVVLQESAQPLLTANIPERNEQLVGFGIVQQLAALSLGIRAAHSTALGAEELIPLAPRPLRTFGQGSSLASMRMFRTVLLAIERMPIFRSLPTIRE